jgi:hypothetical protein
LSERHSERNFLQEEEDEAQRRQEGRREWLGREGSYQGNADVSMGLPAVDVTLLLGNGDSFHDCGPQVDKWVTLLESVAEIQGDFTGVGIEADSSYWSGLHTPQEFRSHFAVT